MRRISLALTASLALVIGCLWVPPAAAAPPVSFDDFALVGGAQVIDGHLRLTTNDYGQAGGGWWTERQAVGSGFRASFTYKMTHRTGGGSDGLAFVIQNSGPSELGESGGGIGYDGIPDSLAVEFDTYCNGNGEPPQDHVSVHTRGVRPNSADESASIGMIEVPNLGDGKKHHVVVRYRAPRMRILFDGTQILLVHVRLDTKLALSDGTAWVGFTGATGGGTQEHWITRFAYEQG